METATETRRGTGEGAEFIRQLSNKGTLQLPWFKNADTEFIGDLPQQQRRQDPADLW